MELKPSISQVLHVRLNVDTVGDVLAPWTACAPLPSLPVQSFTIHYTLDMPGSQIVEGTISPVEERAE